MKPWTDAEITERNKEIEEGIRQCNVALKDLDDEQTAGKPGKENTNMSAIQKWDSKIEELKQRGMTQAQAIHTIVAKDPQLHKDYLKEYTQAHSRLF